MKDNFDLQNTCVAFCEYLDKNGVTAMLIAANKVGSKYKVTSTIVAPDEQKDYIELLSTAILEAMKRQPKIADIINNIIEYR